MDQQIVKNILSGNIFLVPDYLKLVPKHRLCIFVSSTFTDTYKERNILHESILPKLQKKALANDLQVILYDMRFGVKDSNSIDHLTWVLCKEGIKQCFEGSDGLFFLSLQGDKYGYTPIPKFVEKDLFETAMNNPTLTDDVLEMACKWYILDTNHLPPRYELKHLGDINDSEFWKVVLPSLRENLLNSLPFDSLSTGPSQDDEDFLYVNRSVTEWECLYAFTLSKEKCYWIQRHFDKPAIYQGYTSNSKYWDLCDTMGSPSKELKLKILLGKMSSALSDKTFELQGSIQPDDYLGEGPNIMLYLRTWEEVTTAYLEQELTAAILREKKWKYGNKVVNHISAAYFEEIFLHCKLAYQKTTSFIGREELVQRGLEMIRNPTLSIKEDSRYKGIALAVIGKSGSGKTNLMAKLACLCYKQTDNVPVIIRFCGVSGSNVKGMDLVQSIIIQLSMMYNLDTKEYMKQHVEKAQSYEQVVNCFHNLMNQYPVFLFIDSLDQLSNLNEERSQLSFLRDLQPHEKSKIIVSTLQDEMNPDMKTWKYYFGCEKKLRMNGVPCFMLSNIQLEDEQKYFMNALLSQRQRSINPSQWTYLYQTMEEPSMLYMKLSMEVLCLWKSTDISVSIGGTVVSLIHQIFESLEITFGKLFVSYAFAYITFSRDGVNDLEMQDLLSLNDEVISDTFQYFKLNKNRFPIHVWLRLKQAINNLTTEKNSLCIQWYHRQLQETAVQRYQSLEQEVHRAMGQYFADLIDYETSKGRMVRAQDLSLNSVPIWFNTSRINRRRSIEAAYHLVKSSSLEEAIEEMCSFPSICASALISDLGHYLVTMKDLLRKARAASLDTGLVTKLAHYDSWLGKEISNLLRHPRELIVSTATSEPWTSVVRTDMLELIEESRSWYYSNLFERIQPYQGSWVIQSTFTGVGDFQGLLGNLKGHSDGVVSAAWSPDDTLLVSGSCDKTVKVWDMSTGIMTMNLDGHSDKVTSVCWNHEGTRIISASVDQLIIIWDMLSGDPIYRLKGHSDAVLTLALASQDSPLLASGSKDKEIKIWNSELGELLFTWCGHDDAVTGMAWSLDNVFLASGSADMTVRIWNASNLSGSVVYVLSGYAEPYDKRSIAALDWRPMPAEDTAKYFLVTGGGGGDGSIKVWNIPCLQDSQNVPQLYASWSNNSHHSLNVSSVSWTADGMKILVSSYDQQIKLYDLNTQEVVYRQYGMNSPAEFARMSRDESKIVACWGSGNLITIYDASVQNNNNSYHNHANLIFKMDVSADYQYIATAGGDKLVIVWDAKNGKAIHVLEGHTDWMVNDVAWCHTDQYLLASCGADKTVRVWCATHGLLLFTCSGHKEAVNCAIWSRNDSQLFSSSWDEYYVYVWSAKSGVLLSTLPTTTQISCCKLGAEDRFMLSSSKQQIVQLWEWHSDAQDNLSLQLLSSFDNAKRVEWSADSSRFSFVSCEDYLIYIYEMSSKGECNLTTKISIQLARDSSLAWHPNGNLIAYYGGDPLAARGDDGRVVVCDITTGQIVWTLKGHCHSLCSGHWNSDGSKFYAATNQRTIKIFEILIDQE